MSLFDIFNRKPSPQLVLPLPVNNVRKGMWVMYKNNPAVVAGFNSNTGVIEVHITDKVKGETIGIDFVKDPGLLRQCRYVEVPKGRRQASKIVFTSLGYGD